ncbi:MAG: MalY/PatB family protein [Eubacteriales bacterium]|nr:MalY/PatB family protein [Eubacteriales bacterium]
MPDFDRIIDRHNTNSLKHDFVSERGYPEDVLPLWVADMDFRAPEPVLQALRRSVEHGIFGYSDIKKDYYEAAANWFSDRFNWFPQEEWLVTTPGVVFALAMAVRTLTEPGDSVLVQPPVYYPFFSVVRHNDRRLVESELVYENSKYMIDFEDFERRIVDQKVKLFILCSPHNPVGRVWTPDELSRIGDICKKHCVYIVSDEIHCDFTLPGHRHHILLNAVPEIKEQVIVCTAPSKTFNLAGLQASNIWIPNGDIRRGFRREMSRCGYSNLNLMGIRACQAAYESGGDWLEECRTYLRGNLDFLRSFLQQHIPQIRLVEPEGTYFAWLDCSGLGLSGSSLNELIVKRSRLWLDTGEMFGKNSSQFQRIVLACPRPVLSEALNRLEKAVREL